MEVRDVKTDCGKIGNTYYTFKQVLELMSITRSWTLNNPAGGLPYLPVAYCDWVSEEDNEKATKETMPPYKETNPLIEFLIKSGYFNNE